VNKRKLIDYYRKAQGLNQWLCGPVVKL